MNEILTADSSEKEDLAASKSLAEHMEITKRHELHPRQSLDHPQIG